jgi:signal transduction histidine kinase
LESIDLSKLVRQQIDLYQPALAARNHTLSADIQDRVFVNGDISLMHRIVSNLFDNELAHLPDGRRIYVTVRAQNQDVELMFEDDGPGFSPDLRNHVLERFVKGKDSRGRGLGLAFVNAVARAQGGSVNISDRSGGGAAIVLRLPMSRGDSRSSTK